MRNLNVKITLSLLGVLGIGPATGCTNGVLIVSDVVKMPGVIAVDTIIPSVSITTPTGGTTLSQNSGNLTTTYQTSGTNSNSILSQTMTVSGTCYNNSSTVTLYIDSPSSAPWGSVDCSGASSTEQTCIGATCGSYTATLNALALTAGTHTLYAVATDSFGTKSTPATVSVTRKATYYLGRNFYTYKPVALGGTPTSELNSSNSAVFVPVGTNGAAATTGIHNNKGSAAAYYKDADVTIYRDVASKSGTGSATITLTPTLVSATITDVSNTSAVTATFDETDTVAIVTAGLTTGTNLQIQTNSATTGDKYFTVTLSSPSTPLGELISTTGFGTLAANPALASQAQINIIDPQVLDNSTTPAPYGDYIFGHSFFTLNQNSSAAITIQKVKGVGTSSTAVVKFVDGTAGASTDYTPYANQTITFPIGTDEVTLTVTSPSTVTSSRSFYAKLITPSAGTYVRAQSIAKIRILKAEAVDTTTTQASLNSMDISGATTCYANNTSASTATAPHAAQYFGGGNGSSAYPYLICSLAHLNRINSLSVAGNNYSSGLYFKMVTDIDANPSLTPSIGATPLFKGTSFDGNERTIANFTLTSDLSSCTVNDVGSQSCSGFFASTQAAASGAVIIKNMNMLYYSFPENVSG